LWFSSAFLQVTRLVDALESRVVSSQPPAVLRGRLAALSERLALLEAQLAVGNAKGLRHAADALAATVDLQVRVLS
jgi:hypothetical protein